MADRIAIKGADALAGAAGRAILAPTVLIAIVDVPLLAAGYRAVIGRAPDLRVAWVVERRDGVADEVVRLAADIVVIDAPSSAIADAAPAGTIEAIRAARPEVRILAVASRCGVESHPPAITGGADGLLPRESTPADVLAALRALGRREAWAGPAMPTGGPNAAGRAANVPSDAWGAGRDGGFDALAEEAREVFRLAALGGSSREIARKLGTSEQDVHAQRALMMERLGLHRRVELLRYALRHGIVRAADL